MIVLSDSTISLPQFYHLSTSILPSFYLKIQILLVLRSLSAVSDLSFSRAYVSLFDAIEDLNFLQHLIDRDPDLSVDRACEILGVSHQAAQDFFAFEPFMPRPEFDPDYVRPKK